MTKLDQIFSRERKLPDWIINLLREVNEGGRVLEFSSQDCWKNVNFNGALG